MIRPWMGRRAVLRMPHPAVLVTVVVLVLGYVPETGLDHLHLHVEDGHEFVHDHLHVGRHEHGHRRHPAAPTDSRNDHGESHRGGSAMVSYSQAAQVRPPPAEVAQATAAVQERPWLEADQNGQSAEVHSPCNPRAPPT